MSRESDNLPEVIVDADMKGSWLDALWTQDATSFFGQRLACVGFCLACLWAHPCLQQPT
jgi:hypothetical protein